MTFPAPPPIVANASPVPDQIAVGLRYALMAVAAIATALGATKVAGGASALLDAVGPLAMLIVFLWGQIRTRQASQDKATLAAAAPDSVGVVK